MPPKYTKIYLSIFFVYQSLNISILGFFFYFKSNNSAKKELFSCIVSCTSQWVPMQFVFFSGRKYIICHVCGCLKINVLYFSIVFGQCEGTKVYKRLQTNRKSRFVIAGRCTVCVRFCLSLSPRDVFPVCSHYPLWTIVTCAAIVVYKVQNSFLKKKFVCKNNNKRG